MKNEIEAAAASRQASPFWENWAPNVTEIYKEGYTHGFTEATGGMPHGLKRANELKEAPADTWMWSASRPDDKTGTPFGIHWYTKEFNPKIAPKPFTAFTESQLENAMVEFGPTRQDAISRLLDMGAIVKRHHKLVKPVYEWTPYGREMVDRARILTYAGGPYSPPVGSVCTGEQLAEIGGNLGPLDPEDGAAVGYVKRVMKEYDLEWTEKGAVYMLTEMAGRTRNGSIPRAVRPAPGDPVTEEQLEWIEEMEEADVDIEAGLTSGMWKTVVGCSCRDYCPEKRYRLGPDQDGVDESLGKPKEEVCGGTCDKVPQKPGESPEERTRKMKCEWEEPTENPSKRMKIEVSSDEREMGMHDLPQGFSQYLKKHINEADERRLGGDAMLRSKNRKQEEPLRKHIPVTHGLDFLDDVRGQVMNHYRTS